VLDQDWFLDVLTKKDLVFLCNEFKQISVEGFTRNLNNAPENKLITGIKNALNNGFKKQKRNAIVFEDMLKDIVKGVKTKCPYINNLTFEEFIIKAETDSNIVTYEIIAVIYIDFPDLYKTHKQIMMENLKKSLYICHGLSEELSRPIIDKMQYFIHTKASKDENYNFLKRFQEDIMVTDKAEFFKEICQRTKTEEDTFKLLTETHEKERYFVLVSFLLYDHRYKEAKYNQLLEFSLREIQHYYLRTYREQVEKGIERSMNYETQNRYLKEENKRLNTNYTETKGLLAQTEEDFLSTLETLETVELKYQKLDMISKQSEPLKMFFLRLVSENQFLIITKDNEHFSNTPFEGVTLSPSDFKKQLRTNPNHTLKEQVVFVTRVSFQTGKEWFQFKKLLEDNQLVYEELGHYEISYYVREIVQYLYRKEILVYADEI